MKDEVIALLSALNYEYNEETDGYFLDFMITKVQNDILAAINTSDIPEEMHTDYVMAVCGEFLQLLKDSGRVDPSALSFDGISSIKEGDTTIEFFSGGSSDDKFSNLVDYLTRWREKVPRFRVLLW